MKNRLIVGTLLCWKLESCAFHSPWMSIGRAESCYGWVKWVGHFNLFWRCNVFGWEGDVLPSQVSARERFYGKRTDQDPTRPMLPRASTSTFLGVRFLEIIPMLVVDEMWWNSTWFHTQRFLGSLCVCVFFLCQGGGVLFEKQLIHTVAVPSWVFLERCHEMCGHWDSSFKWRWWQYQKRSLAFNRHWAEARIKNVWKISWNLKIYIYTVIYMILPIYIHEYWYMAGTYISQIYLGLFPTMQSWKVKILPIGISYEKSHRSWW